MIKMSKELRIIVNRLKKFPEYWVEDFKFRCWVFSYNLFKCKKDKPKKEGGG